jgi:hypothetical protein
MVLAEIAPPFIARHNTGCDTAFLSERLNATERLFERGWEYLSRRPANIAAMFGDALDATGWRVALNPDDPLLYRDLKRAARCACATLQMLTPGPAPIVVDVGLSPVVEVPRLAVNDLFNVSDLEQALFAAMICRDWMAIEALCQVKPRSLDVAGSITDDYNFTFAEFLQGMWTRQPSTGDMLMRALEETDPDKLRTGNVDYALYIMVPIIDLFYSFAGTDPTSFNTKLAYALDRHRRFYSAVEPNPGESQRNDPRGFIALGPLAAAAVAHDRGWAVTVTSDYLPAGLVDGRFGR